MFGILWDFFTKPLVFKRTVAALALGLGVAASTSAGAEILKGDLSEVTRSQWWRFAFSAVTATFAGGFAAGGKKSDLTDDELEILRPQIAALKARRQAAAHEAALEGAEVPD